MRRLLPVAAVLAALMAPAAADPPVPALPVVDGVPLCGTEGTGTGADDGAFKVASFNVLHSDTDEGDQSLGARLELGADTLVASGADVIGMQEVTSNFVFDAADEYPQKHGRVAQRFAAELAERTASAWHWCFFRSNPHVPGTPDVQPGGGNPLDDMAAQFGNFPNDGDFSEGLAVVSRFPIEEARSHRLLPRSYEAVACIPPDPLACNLAGVFDSRQVLWARIGAPGGAVDLFDTHIAHGITALSNATKLAQIHQILAWMELWSDPATPDLFTGDFNSSPGTDRIAAVTSAGFTDSWAAANGAAPGHTGNPPPGDEVWSDTAEREMGERIDYVFARGCSTTASEIIGANAALQSDGTWLWPSDHLGLTSTLACPL